MQGTAFLLILKRGQSNGAKINVSRDEPQEVTREDKKIKGKIKEKGGIFYEN